MNFGQLWRKRIMGCLSSCSMLVLINGCPISEFSLEKGLCQGNPLSPFLFIKVMKALNITINEAAICNKFKGISMGHEELKTTHLQYVDDALFFGDWSIINASNLIDILHRFEKASGLQINISKSKLIGVNVTTREFDDIAEILNCLPGELPFTYLGLPVGNRMSLSSAWIPVTGRLLSRLNGWKAKLLSIGGRLTLTKAFLGSLPNFYLSLFRAPIKLYKNRSRLGGDFYGIILIKKQSHGLDGINVYLKKNMGVWVSGV
ncbi:uncharacterized protein [Rutidosis leptorrhynchoides]|uniref:uncharacterized protein n=1 Tax=Rutidosis leptorrhynchoides TaxID=125765 RepID=UPI003A98D805